MICHDKKVLVITPLTEGFAIELRENGHPLFEGTADILNLDIAPLENYWVKEYLGAVGPRLGRRPSFAERFLSEPSQSRSES